MALNSPRLHAFGRSAGAFVHQVGREHGAAEHRATADQRREHHGGAERGGAREDA